MFGVSEALDSLTEHQFEGRFNSALFIGKNNHLKAQDSLTDEGALPIIRALNKSPTCQMLGFTKNNCGVEQSGSSSGS